MPINYRRLKKAVETGDFASVARQLMLENPRELLDEDKKEDLIAIAGFFQAEANTELLINCYDNILELLKRRRFFLLKTEEDERADLRREKLYVYADHTTADTEEKAMQRRVSERFFRVAAPPKPRSHSEQLYGQIRAYLRPRRDGRRAPDSVLLDGFSFRALNLAMVKVVSERQVHPIYPRIQFKIGETTMTCHIDDEQQTRTQKANHWVKVEELPNERFTYGRWRTANATGVGQYLAQLCGDNPARISALASKLQENSASLSSFSFEDFNQHGAMRLEEEAAFDPEAVRAVRGDGPVKKVQEHIHYLNGFMFLYLNTEIVRRLYRPGGHIFGYANANARESDGMPMGVYHAEILKLLVSEDITLNDVVGSSEEVYGREAFNHRAKAGPGTGRSTIANMDITRAKTVRLNQAKEQSVLRGDLRFFGAPQVVVDDFQRAGCAFKSGHNLMKSTLLDSFGGGSDSEGEDYSDDEVGAVAAGVAGLGLGAAAEN